MRLALTELRRRPSRFLIVTGALAFIVVLLLVLGALLDGLYLNSTGALRSVGGDSIVYSQDANNSLLRSRITAVDRDEIESVDGVSGAGGLGVTLVGSRVDDESDLIDTAVIGYERAGAGIPAPAGAGQGFADSSLRSDGVDEGSVLRVGPGEVGIEIVGFVDDANYLQQGGVWVGAQTWREVQATARPDSPYLQGEWQALEIDTGGESVREAVDRATGSTATLSVDGAVDALPGITEQNRTFNAVIGATFFVAGLVVALFFVLLTLERVALYGLLKAVGTPTRRLVVGLMIQSLAVAVVAFLIGGLASAGLERFLPDEVPAQFEPSRALFVAVGLAGTALIGALFSLRRVLRVDPARAIGRQD